MSILCEIGLHKWEEEPSTKELLRSTGRHFAFSSEAKQIGAKKCLRKGCEAIKPVYRTGWLSVGGGNPSKWKKASPKTQKEISSLPVL